MQVNIIGYQVSNFTPDNGQTMSGYSVHWVEPIDTRYGEGHKGCRGWVRNENIFGKLKLGEATLDFNQYGKIGRLSFDK